MKIRVIKTASKANAVQVVRYQDNKRIVLQHIGSARTDEVLSDLIMAIGMHLVSRLRDDADLKYLFLGPATGGKGRSKKYVGKIDIANIDTDYFELVEQNPGATIYSAIVYYKIVDLSIYIVQQKSTIVCTVYFH